MHYPNYTLDINWIIDDLKAFANMSPEETKGETLNFKITNNKSNRDTIRQTAQQYGWSITWNNNGSTPNDKRANFMNPDSASRAMTNTINIYCTKTTQILS